MSSTSPRKVCIVGSGNWGSAIARIVGVNAKAHADFDNTVNMWVFEEMIDGKKLTEIINETHENVKYLKGYKIPENVVAIPDVKKAVEGAQILIFVLPHQFVERICSQIKGCVDKDAMAISLIKGMLIKDKGLQLITDVIKSHLNIEVNCLMGANLAPEVAAGYFCETTIGCRDPEVGKVLKRLFQADYFRIVVVEDATTVELCGALKNIVAVGAGIIDGLGLGDNTKAAIIRLGLMEMVAFSKEFYHNTETATFLESCGVADLITTCYGGRNRRVAEAFVKTGKSIEELEKEMLNGQKLQGPQTAQEVHVMLENKNMTASYPLFTAIYDICFSDLPAKNLISCLNNHPVHM
ncbi:glycerol-3-phosphate dehydrogenase [NAD(+)], cytoplasmic-like [Acanthaster planci]|uniref:Glycerol-3-phosphate dehydrogenase [NAD(+)] n=1 Tax=Acanthaster planci TaxID=133434 RepID=A0A8B7XXD0_ACAPL|nr:glycerol-3-phosphate dehydrogenase [NAD(+)], cytoplasmic-like [Acanthaster planci]